MEIDLLKELLYLSWNKYTCTPNLREEWSLENPSVGQSDVTSLIVNDMFGGKIMRCIDSCYYNVIDDEIIDLTGEVSNYDKGEEITREDLLNDDARSRYDRLLHDVRHNLIDIDFDCIALNPKLNEYKDYLNSIYMFCNYDLDNYRVDSECEYVRILLESQNSGLFIDAKHNLEIDVYESTIEEKEFPLSKDFLKAAFDVAKEYKNNIKLEKKLQDACVNLRQTLRK